MSKKLGIGALALFVISSVGCGGGGGGGGGDSVDENVDNVEIVDNALVSSSGSVAYGEFPGEQFSFSATRGHAYTVTVTSTLGDADAMLTSKPFLDEETTSSFYTSSNTAPEPEIMSFIGNVETVYAYVYTEFTGSSDYTFRVTENHLEVGGAAHTGYLYSDENIYYSFDALAGKSYRVTVTPTTVCVKRTGCDEDDIEADLRVYANASGTGDTLSTGTTIGSSYNDGKDEIAFTATEDGIHYIRVDGGYETNFSVDVEEIGEQPDLVVSIDEAIAGESEITLNYTIRNRGMSSAAPFSVYFLADSATIPAATNVQGLQEMISVELDSGESYTGTIALPNSSISGTAYGIVDPEGVVAEDDEINNVSPGLPWTIYVEAPRTYDFENGQLPAEFVSSEDASWVIDSTTNSDGGTYSLKAGTIGNDERSCFEISAGNVGTLSFQWKVESADDDPVKFLVNGSNRNSIDGVRDWRTVTYTPSNAGVNHYKWCFRNNKDGISYGRNTAWIDNIQFTIAKPNLTVSLTGASTDGANVTLDYTVYNGGNADAAASTLQLWPHLDSAPLVNYAGGTAVQIPVIATRSNYTGSTTIPYNLTTTGRAYAAIDSPFDSIDEVNEADNVSSVRTWSYQPNLKVAITASSDGANVTVNYIVSNTGSADAPASTLQIWPSLVSAPLVSDTGGTAVAIGAIPVGESVSGSSVFVNANLSGTAYAAIDSPDNSIVESNESDNVSGGAPWIGTTPLVAYSFEDGQLPAEFVASGNMGWAVVSDRAAEGTYSIRSWGINDYQSACTSVTAANSSAITFAWSVSSRYNDYLRFYIDDVLQDSIHREIPWTNKKYEFTAASHTFKWCYIKDSYSYSGADAGWVDAIRIY